MAEVLMTNIDSTRHMVLIIAQLQISLQWRHNGRNGVSNFQHHDCLLNRLFKRRSKKTSKLRITGLWAGNSPVTGEFPAQRASNAENVSIWWRHHVAPIYEIDVCNASHKTCHSPHRLRRVKTCSLLGLLRLVLWWLHSEINLIHMIHLYIFFRVPSLSNSCKYFTTFPTIRCRNISQINWNHKILHQYIYFGMCFIWPVDEFDATWCSINRPVSQIRAPSGGLSWTSGKLWQDCSNCYMFWT